MHIFRNRCFIDSFIHFHIYKLKLNQLRWKHSLVNMKLLRGMNHANKDHVENGD